MFKNLIYNGKTKEVTETKIDNVSSYLKDKSAVILVDLHKPSESDYKKLGSIFDFHQLTLDDAHKNYHLPKIDEYPDYLFLIWQALNDNPKTEKIENTQVNFFLGKNYLVVTHNEELELIKEVYKRCIEDTGFIASGADWLLHMYLDKMADEYFPLMDKLSSEVDKLEDDIFVSPTTENLKSLFSIKHKLLDIRKAIAPQRDIVAQMGRFETKFINSEYIVYFRDVYDHLMRIIDLVDSTRDIVSGAMDIYLSQVSNNLNDIMKKLTIVATIVLPLTLITGVYGMNFKHMPELESRFSYFIVLGAMVIFAVSMFIYFRKKKWW